MATLLISLILAAAIAVGCILVSHYRASQDADWDLLKLSGETGEREYLPIFPTRRFRCRRLSPEEWNGFIRVWFSIRARFDRDPKTVVTYADLLMSDLVAYGDSCRSKQARMRDIGDSGLNEKYRVAHAIATSAPTHSPNLDELRLAMSLYVSLFDEVLLRTGHTQWLS